MLWLAAAAALAAPPQPHGLSRPAAVQATATVRIISGVQLRLDGSDNPGVPRVRDSQVRVKDGTVLPARLIEFP